MRISDWSSDVCSSDLSATAPWPSRPGEVRIRMQLAPIRETGPGLLNSGSEFGEAWLLPPAREHRVPTRSWSIPALRSEEHTSELQSLMRISYAVFCLKKKHIIYILNSPHYQ